jgi:hypothetical protein
MLSVIVLNVIMLSARLIAYTNEFRFLPLPCGVKVCCGLI